jgi:4-hydroxy-4-methyl-2-oxoglutarate aldolase
MTWDDEAVFPMIRQELFTAVVGDVLDSLGYIHQFLPPTIHPLRPDMIVVGRAMPVLEADCYYLEDAHENGGSRHQPFGLMFEALDDLKLHEVYVAAGSSAGYALWGELMATRALRTGCAGSVVHGYSRDTRGLLRLGFPTFSFGSYAQDQRARGRVIDYRVAIEIGQVAVRPGDLVFGDLDGVVIVPRAAERETIALALEKVRKENTVRTAIENGMTSVEAFRTYDVM